MKICLCGKGEEDVSQEKVYDVIIIGADPQE